MHIPKGGSNRKLLRDGTERVVNQEAVRSCRKELVRADTAVVNAIFHSTSDANLHLEDLVHGCHFLEVLRTDTDILIVGFLRQVKHVGGEQCLDIYLEVFLISFNHPIKPREQLLGTMVRMAEHRDAICRSNIPSVMCACNSSPM